MIKTTKNISAVSRRTIMIQGLRAGVLGSVVSLPALSQAAAAQLEPGQSPGKRKPPEATMKLMKLLNLKYPIIQAPTGGVASVQMISAVAEKGALGGLPLTWSGPEGADKRIKWIQEKTAGSFFANFVLNFDPVSFEQALESGIKIIQFSWGMPSQKMVDLMRLNGTKLGIQVTSQASAQRALQLGADYLVCQGTEAGGHVHASRSLADALERVLKVAGEVPVAASGGIATGAAMRKYISSGAAGVVMGSRFVATQESGAHEEYKDALVNAKREDTVFTVCMNKGWDGSTHRILREETFEMWEAAGCPVVGKRPGESDEVAHYGPENPVERYSINAPNTSVSGNIAAMAQYAGEGVGEIEDIPSVGELIDRIWAEYLEG